MPMFRQCCCCCDLKTGVILIGVFTVVMSGYNIISEVLLLNKIPLIEQYMRDNPSKAVIDTYGIDEKYLESLSTITTVGCVLNGVNILAAIFLLIPACFSDPGQGRKFKPLIFIWVAWNVIQILWSFGFGGWIVSKYSNPLVAVSILAALIISLPLSIYFILVAIAFYQELGEDGAPATSMMPPSNVPYAHMESGNMPPPAYEYESKGSNQYTKPV